MSLDAPTTFCCFARVVDEGSFSRAAERLGLPKSTVSRRVAALETQLGERLLLRTTRKLTLTDFGRNVLDHAHHVAEEVDAADVARAATARRSRAAACAYRCPDDLASLVLSPIFSPNSSPATRRSRWKSTCRRAGVDLDRRELRPRDPHGRPARRRLARRAAHRDLVVRHLFAAPAYLARRGTPSEPEALMEHDALRAARRAPAIPRCGS